MLSPALTLHEAFIHELRDCYDAEQQLTKVLPKMARAASSLGLKAAFEDHLDKTRGHLSRLEQVFRNLRQPARGRRSLGIAGIVTEGDSVLGEDFDEATLDACLIASGQRAEHYEMAVYGTLVAWARAMGRPEDADLLVQTLEEEKAADRKLAELADGGINQEAADSAFQEE
jgi:ferritin-like metal-binding protein YciE